MGIIEKIVKYAESIEINATRTYLILANIILAIFAIWFSNVGLLPFGDVGNFAFFAVLALILGLYRPSWTFAFFIGTLVLENINIAPKGFGISLRPYQFFGIITIVALLAQLAFKRLVFTLPKWHWFDTLPILFALAGFLSALASTNKGATLKQAIVAVSFVALYFLARVYIQTLPDLKRVAPFFLSSSIVVLLYSIWQNLRFLSGAIPFEAMPGRPNGTFTEADWLGIYLVFLLSIVYSMIYYFNKNGNNRLSQISNSQFPISNKFSISQLLNYTFVTLIFITLVISVSRSAWVGAVIVTIGFLKIILTNGTLKIGEWHWKKFSLHSVAIFFALAISMIFIQVVPLSNFQIASRAASTGGLQKITISCQPGHAQVPGTINDISQLAQYDCKFINLENISSEKAQGNEVSEIFRTDPTENIRSQIYQKSIVLIEEHPIFGIGWGTISTILGTDERGVGLNASNIFLETWLGSGLIGILSFVILLGYIFIIGLKQYLNPKVPDKTTSAFVLLGWAAVVIPNLFNSGIFLGFVWVYLAVAVGLLEVGTK